jgi:hypothetical protein
MANSTEEQYISHMRQQAVRLVWLLAKLEEWMLMTNAEGNRVKSITVRPQKDGSGDMLVIVRAQVEGEHKVGFHSSGTAAEAVKGALERVLNSSIDWREDQFAKD